MRAQEHGSITAMLRRPIVVEETMQAGVTRARVVVECVIDRYHQRMQIIDRQHEAGITFRKLWRAASLGQSVVGSYGDVRGGEGGNDTSSDARGAVKRALLRCYLAREAQDEQPVLIETLSGEKHWPVAMPILLNDAGHITVSVCGLDEWAGGTRRLTTLRNSLDTLADFWGIERE